MQKLLWVLIMIATMSNASTWERIMIGTQALDVLQEAYDLYDSKGISARFYLEDDKEDMHHLLTLVMDDQTGGCSGKSIQKGTYKVKGNTLILYHLWDRKRSQKEAPFGASIEVYTLYHDKLKRVSNKIYIESHAFDKNDKSAMQYLFNPPQTPAQKAQLLAYKKEIEKRYKGKFVAKEPLLSEVQKALKPKKHTAWKTFQEQ